MNRKQLAEAIAEETGLSHGKAARVVNVVLDCIVRGATEDERGVILSNFGTFRVKTRAASVARDPRNGEQMVLPAQPWFRFYPSKCINRTLRAGRKPTAAKRPKKSLS